MHKPWTFTPLTGFTLRNSLMLPLSIIVASDYLGPMVGKGQKSPACYQGCLPRTQA